MTGNSCHYIRRSREYRNCPFSDDIILNQNYIVISTSLSLINIRQNYIGLYYFLILKALLARPSNPLVPTYKQGRKEGAGTTGIVYKFRSSRLDVLHKKYLKVLERFHENSHGGVFFY